ncbi:MAG TPA: hypothetical protein VGH28_31165 [Polyangiaceae bacterium]|jgi:hypothetical protein
MKLRSLGCLAVLAVGAAHCGDANVEQGADDLATVTDDDLNGLWVTTQNGTKLSGDTVIESWQAVGIQMNLGSNVTALTRSGDTLTAPNGSLAVAANGYYPTDDSITGTIDGQSVTLKRDTAAKKPITLSFPGDRPFRALLSDTILPLAQQDRESYTVLHASSMSTWLHKCELYKHDSWQSKLAGTTWAERSASFAKIVSAVNDIKTTPREMTHESKFTKAVVANLADQSQAGLWISSFGMYFTTAAGRGIRMPIAPDSTAYFITDRPARGALIGLSVMDTPLHGPLASTFGRQLLDLGAMPTTDDSTYARSMMELLAKSDNHRASTLSPAGRSALTDWFAVMAIEDYRGVAFGMPTLDWGSDMTNVQMYGLVVRALGNQVLVGSELRPGDPSYADVLNGGGDMQEYPDMSALKTLATGYLRAAHPDLIANVENAFAGVEPAWEFGDTDIFRTITAELYDAATPNLKGASADAAIDAVVALFDALSKDSSAFEAYVLSQGYTKSSVPAPKSTGY